MKNSNVGGGVKKINNEPVNYESFHKADPGRLAFSHQIEQI